MVYTDYQRLELEKEFRTTQFINSERKSQLSSELQLTERQIKIWFQNRWMCFDAYFIACNNYGIDWSDGRKCNGVYQHQNVWCVVPAVRWCIPTPERLPSVGVYQHQNVWCVVPAVRWCIPTPERLVCCSSRPLVYTNTRTSGVLFQPSVGVYQHQNVWCVVPAVRWCIPTPERLVCCSSRPLVYTNTRTSGVLFQPSVGVYQHQNVWCVVPAVRWCIPTPERLTHIRMVAKKYVEYKLSKDYWSVERLSIRGDTITFDLRKIAQHRDMKVSEINQSATTIRAISKSLNSSDIKIIEFNLSKLNTAKL
uniref:Homeobox domain-containing protein n=1 Tax=Ascaris lumbricoides TaxID=6252 RepID=A0A9J2PVY4_ASCLU